LGDLCAVGTSVEKSVMRTSPSIAPHGPDQDTYIVLDDFGAWLGRAWRETDEDAADRETVIDLLLAGEYSNPVCVVAFNIAEGRCRDASIDIADEVRRRVLEYDQMPETLIDFLDANRR
jgi:hypothetical protein